MIDFFWRYRKTLIVAILAATAVYITVTTGKDEEDYNIFDRIIVNVSAPLQQGIDWMLDGAGATWERYVDNAKAATENAALREELAQLRRKQKEIDEVRRENRRLLDLLGLIDRSHDTRYLPARVIANATSSQFRSVRIDQGRNAGVQRGMGVMAEAGLVGRVMAAESGYADVMLLSDTQSSIGIVVGRSRARGQLRGLGDPAGVKARIDYLGRSSPVEIGDEVLTTGAGRVFPRGVLVGYVRSVNRTEHGLYQEAIVEPAVPLYGLDEVVVVLGFGPEAIVDVSPASQPATLPGDELADIEPIAPHEAATEAASAPVVEP